MGSFIAPPVVLAATRYPGVGPRAVATVIDGIVGFVLIGVPLLFLFGTTTTFVTATGTTTTHSTHDPKVLALWAVLAIVYYVLFEAWLGATPGKLILGLRVRNEDGSRLHPRAALIRNVLRIVDAFPYLIPYLVGAVAVWADDSQALVGEHASSGRRRRVGDRVARTIVTYR
jgi:uncharacterized RDD family membrane protein YckC